MLVMKMRDAMKYLQYSVGVFIVQWRKTKSAHHKNFKKLELQIQASQRKIMNDMVGYKTKQRKQVNISLGS